MKCPNCGNNLNENIRYCFSCGSMNPYCPENQSFISNMGIKSDLQANENGLNVANGTVFVPTYDKKTFIVVNLLVYLAVILIIIGLQLMDVTNSQILNKTIVGIFAFSISYFYLISIQKLLIKADLPWWGIFIPIYNMFLCYKMVFGNYKLLLFQLISEVAIFLLYFLSIKVLISGNLILALKISSFARKVINIFVYFNYFVAIAYLFCLGKSFGRSGLLMIFFGFVLIPTTAFSKKYCYERDFF